MKNSSSHVFEIVLAALLLINLCIACDPHTNTDPRIMEELHKEGATLNLYWPANGTIKAWIVDTLVPGYKQFVKDTYGVDMTVNILQTNKGGDDEFFRQLTTYEQSHLRGGKTFPIDLVRIVPSLELLNAGQKGWLLPLLPHNASVLFNWRNINPPGLGIFTRDGKTFAMPIYQPTISFFYNKEKLLNPPRSLDDLISWVRENPRRFTYEDPSSSNTTGFGSGAVFLLMMMKRYADPDTPDSYGGGFARLRQMQPYLYPETRGPDELMNLMKHEDIWLMPYWNNEGLVVAEQQHISFMTNYFPSDRTPVRNTPLAVPRSAQHPLAALLFMNFAISDNIQQTMALKTRQFPASVSSSVLQTLRDSKTFGSVDIDYIKQHIYPAFNSEANLRGIDTMMSEYKKQVQQ